MNCQIGTPEGTRDRLYAECAACVRAEDAVTNLFAHRGYSQVTTPYMEFYDLFTQSGNPMPQAAMVKTFDRGNRILVMRPDNTTPIARIAATKLKAMPLPQRLYYNQPVFRSDDAHLGVRGEIRQCGVELLGAAGLRADVEVVALAIEALEACGLTDFSVELGHAGYFQALSAELSAEDAVIDRMRELIEEQNFAAFHDLLRPYLNTEAGRAMEQLSRLFGGIETLDAARRLCHRPEAVAALDYLRALYDELDAAGLAGRVQFDLGLVQRIDYYSGVVFRGYLQGAGSVVLSGGRYDGLVGRFGTDMPATGFAIDMEAVAQQTPFDQNVPPKTVVWYESGLLGRAIARVAALPAGTAVLSAAADRAAAEHEARAHGAKVLLVLKSDMETEVAL